MPTKILAASAAAILVTLTPAAIADEPCAGPGGAIGTPDPTTPERADVCVSVSCDGEFFERATYQNRFTSQTAYVPTPDFVTPSVDVPRKVVSVDASTPPIRVGEDIEPFPSEAVEDLSHVEVHKVISFGGLVVAPVIIEISDVRARTPELTLRSCIEVG